MVMNALVLDEGGLKDLPILERLAKCEEITKNSDDESLRWDAVWIAGEMANESLDDETFDRISKLMAWVLENDTNGVVKHEACYQIAARNMRQNIPDLINASLHNESVLTKHEALESLGLMRAFEAESLITDALNDQSPDVRETAGFVIKRLKRIKNLGDYVPSEVV